jgi:hypothetical protein
LLIEPGNEVLDQRVGRLQQLHEDRAAFGRVCVERQALLVAVEVAEETGAEAAQPPRLVAVDRLDLDHLGPEIGQDHAAGRAEDGVRHLDDANAGKRRRDGGGHGPFHSACTRPCAAKVGNGPPLRARFRGARLGQPQARGKR